MGQIHLGTPGRASPPIKACTVHNLESGDESATKIAPASLRAALEELFLDEGGISSMRGYCKLHVINRYQSDVCVRYGDRKLQIEKVFANAKTTDRHLRQTWIDGRMGPAPASDRRESNRSFDQEV